MMLKWFVVLFLLGMAVFTLAADFGTDLWDGIWAFWQNICYGSVLAWGSLYQELKGEKKSFVRPVYNYSVLLLIWEFTALFTGWSIDNELAVRIFFGITAILIGYIALKNDTRASKLFTKYLPL